MQIEQYNMMHEMLKSLQHYKVKPSVIDFFSVSYLLLFL